MEQVRVAMIGCGGNGKHHLSCMKDLERVKLTAVCDAHAETLEQVSAEYGVPGFDDYRKVIEAKVCDAILISLPHYFHPPVAVEAFAAGLHVLTEKPIAVHTKGAREMIAAHEASGGRVFGAVFQLRTLPIFRKAKELIDRGELGELRRVNYIVTNWLRTQAYYDSGGWRATWKGEGGGVLLNQCPHNLDLLTWLAGSPSRVVAHCALGKYHDIEVEDEVGALLEYANGATGQFYTTTGEGHGVTRLEIVGDRGAMVIDGSRIHLSRSRQSVPEFIRASEKQWDKMEYEEETLVLETCLDNVHKAVTRNFINAIFGEEELIAPGAEGLKGLELGNAMLLSGVRGNPVDLPLDDDEYLELLNELIADAEKKTKAKTS